MDKKKLIYSVAALVLILAGVYLQGKQDAEDVVIGTESIAAESVFDGEALDESAQSEDVVVTEQALEADSELEAAQPEDFVEYYFRNEDLLEQHYEKHGMEMGFESMEAYEEAACAVVNNPDALTKTEAEDGDYVYYVEETNEFVIVSKDGYIRTYFNPSAGIDYYNRQ